ncbi:sensor domain-containing diguanylate cyclase [Legionella sainthelensi]|uniref:sensor domain-containing diguanylate cyclase n=1 Tax=Legionella sainthelensi TaxID=28087 RepID=UPI0021668F87|nr:diguanylate cyclase [Legionella sainthelensi]
MDDNSIPSSKFNKFLLYIIFIPALVLVSGIGILSYHEVNKMLNANKWVAHTYQVIQATDKILITIIDIDSELEAYLLSDDEQLMINIDKMKFDLKEDFDNLFNLIRDNSSQKQRISHFHDLTIQRLKQLNQAIQLKINNKLNTPEEKDFFLQKQDLSNQIKGVAQEIKSIELVLLKERNQVALNSAKTTNIAIVIGKIISFCGLIIAFALANRELSRSLRAEHHRKNVESQLRSILEGATDMIAALDNQYRYMMFNEAYQREFKRLFGHSITIGMTLDDILTSAATSAKKKLMEQWNDSLKSGELVRNIEFEVNKEPNVYEITSSLIKNENNETHGTVHIIRNITKHIQEQIELKESYKKLHAGMQALQDKNEQITLLVEMSDIMLACSSQEELSKVMTKYCQRILHFASGYLYIMHPSKNYLEIATTWGKPNPQETTFLPNDCWAIRLGKMHQVSHSRDELICNHVNTSSEQTLAFLCIPLMAQNDIYGLLYMEISEEPAVAFSQSQQLLITAFSELTALAFANVRLRENLRYQSMRDPLTGLYNRRYLEDFLLKQIHQSERTKSPISLLMLDLDHFKKINDTYGHDAGDVALKELGKILQEDTSVSPVFEKPSGTSESPKGTKTGDKYACGASGRPASA